MRAAFRKRWLLESTVAVRDETGRAVQLDRLCPVSFKELGNNVSVTNHESTHVVTPL